MSRKVLIVHSDPQVAQALTRALAARGHSAAAHTDALGVVMSAVREEPELIVIELDRPLLDGVELFRLIRQSPALTAVPIVFLAPTDGAAARDRVISLGAQGIIDARDSTDAMATHIEDLLLHRRPHLPANEATRVAALHRLNVLDTGPDKLLDELTAAASAITSTPIALVSLVDSDRQWFKSRIGLGATETPRDLAFCAHAIHGSEIFEVPDAAQDERFAANPLVTSDPNIRFYAGTPLVTKEGLGLGTLCVIDRVPRTLTKQQRDGLAGLGRIVTMLLEQRRGGGGAS